MKDMTIKKGVKIILSLFISLSVILLILSWIIPINNEPYEGADFSPLFHCENRLPEQKFLQVITPNDIFSQDELLEGDDTCGYDGAVYQWDDERDDSITFELFVEEAGAYHLGIEYLSLNDTVVDNAITVMVNDTLQSRDAENMRLLSSWTDIEKERRFDSYNNQVLSRQTLLDRWNFEVLRENLMLYDDPVTFNLSEGVNTLTIKKESGMFLMGDILLLEAEEFDDYETYLDRTNAQNTTNELIAIEAEDVTYKNDISIRYESETSLNVSPYDSEFNYLNVVGEYFSKPGQMLNYAFEVEESGYYHITFKYLNDYYQNISSFRNIYIDDQVLFDELNQYAFDYSESWRYETLGLENEPFKIYLEEGIHTLSVEVDGSLMADEYYRMIEMMDEITELSLDINKLTGGVDDQQREWDLDRYLPDAYNSLVTWTEDIEAMIDTLETMNTNDNQSNELVKRLETILIKLEELRDDHDKLPNKMNLLSEGSSSVSRTLSVVSQELLEFPLGLDKIFIHSEDTELPKESRNLLLRTLSGIQRIFRATNLDSNDEDVLEIWVNRSRFYVDLMQQMADSEFTEETGIKVKFSVMPDEQKLIMSNAAGTQPDVALGVSGWLPYELGLRGAAVDLRSFDGFYDTLDQFAPGSILHMMHDDRVYGLPETQDFNVTVYRTDILDQVNLEVPNTYDEIIEMLPTLQRYGMNYYLPLSAESGLKPFAATAPFIYQYGGDLYEEDGFETAINQEESIEAINMMVDLYTVYSLPLQTPNFYDAFRSARIPIGTTNFDTYIRLQFAAPELVNKWDVALAPGVMGEDGEINRRNTGTAQSAVMFEKSEKQEEGWTFLQWWLSTETQSNFAYDLQAIYGREFMWNSANIEAFKTLPIDENHKETIIEQWEQLYEVPKTPGGYIIERELSNIWNTVVFDSENLRIAVDDSIETINRELARKYEEFGYLDGDEVLKPYIVPRIETVEGWLEENLEGGDVE